MNDAFKGILGQIPSRNTIENWIKKCGLDIYNTPEKSLNAEEYAMIVDESMMMGSEKLLFTLGIPAKHTGDIALSRKDVSILDMSVASSWNGDGIQDRLLASSAKIGHSPKYVISDNASIMEKGINQTGFVHYHDISHSLGMFLERCYKDESDFIAYTKRMSEVQATHNMKKTAYLLPPRQRTIARFINLSNWVKWSRKILEVYHQLNHEERALFNFIPDNASLIDELSEVMECISHIEKECKQNGFSKNTIKKCLDNIRNTLFKGNSRMKKLGEAISLFLLKEGKRLKGEGDILNNSSDIIESSFGTYKRRKSPNKLYGVTPFILFMPACTELAVEECSRNYSIKEHLENVKLCQIQQWREVCLTDNLVTKRIKTLKFAV